MKNLILLLFVNITLAQNTSVIEANYFKNNNLQAPIEVGKGFNITNIYEPTIPCFTNESSAENKLVLSKTTSKNTNIKYYYTKTDSEYNNLVKNNFTGKIGFLNIFNIEAKTINNIEDDFKEENERIVLKANVDFGVYSFLNTPILTNEAKSHITNKSFDEFIDKYGTHYISGIRKENSIIITLTKDKTESVNIQDNSSSLGANGKSPFKINGGFELANGSYLNSKLKNTKYTVEIEVNGPSIDTLGLENLINNVIYGNSLNKINDIDIILKNALKNLSNSKDGYYSQYYYTPFKLLGVNNIYWTNEKINKLEQINKNILDVYEAKVFVEKNITDINEFVSEIENINYKKQFKDLQNLCIPKLDELQEKSEYYLDLLNQAYKKCNDITCFDLNICCNTNPLFLEIKKFDINKKNEELITPINDLIEKISNEIEESKEDCEKKNISTIEIVNKSINPYNIYSNNKLIDVVPGKSTKTLEARIGNYSFKCEQKTGFALYPTINNRTIKIDTFCETQTIEIGFED